MMHVTLFQCVMDFVVTCVVSPHWPPIPLPPAVVTLLNQHLVQLLSQFNRVPLSLCGKGFCVVWTKATTPSPVMLRHGGHVIIGTVQGLGWTLLATRDV